MKKKGFTLLEVMIAMLLLSFAVAAMFGVFIGARRFIIRTGHKTEAINFVQEKMEQIKSWNYTALINGTYTDYRNLTDGLSVTRIYEVTPFLDGKRVYVIVQWDEFGVTKTENAVTFIANPGG